MNEKLNKQQQEAVQSLKGPLLIFAGAGTGKTKVITYRIANMIKNGIPPSEILAVTFTNKAAHEMKERLVALVGLKETSRLQISTFHALGVTILKTFITKLGYRSNFSIYTTSDSVSLIRKILKDELEEASLGKPSEIFSMLSIYRLNIFEKKALNLIKNEKMLKFILSNYQKQLKNNNAVDFDDLIYLPIELLKDPEILLHYQNKWKYLMVDEFQDTNTPQYILISKIAEKHQNFCVVGDDDQSIYGFRGSNYKHILNFKNQFSNVNIIKLEENYRSTKTILEAAYSVVKNNKMRQEKKLKSNKGNGEKIVLLKALSEQDEAKLVASQIQETITKNKQSYKNIAVLYRTNSQSRPLEEEFIARKIPYEIIGGTKFFERKEVKDIVAYLKIINNPYDEASLYRIINTPSRGIGDSSLEKINEYCYNHKKKLFDALSNIKAIKDLPQKAETAISSFVDFIIKFKNAKKDIPISKMIQLILDNIKYKLEIQKHYPKPSDADEKWSNCLGLINSAIDFEKEYHSNSLEDFLEHISIMTDEDFSKNKDKKIASQAIKLMTMHNAKGLEFPYVFIVGINETILPHERSTLNQNDIEEERRLFYVGITRAKENLTLSYFLSKSVYGKDINILPSRFLEEIPKVYLEDMSETASDADIKELFSSLKNKFSTPQKLTSKDNQT